MRRGIPCLCSGQARPEAMWINKPLCGNADCHSLGREDHYEGQLAVRQNDGGKIGVTLNANIRKRDLHVTADDRMAVML